MKMKREMDIILVNGFLLEKTLPSKDRINKTFNWQTEIRIGKKVLENTFAIIYHRFSVIQRYVDEFALPKIATSFLIAGAPFIPQENYLKAERLRKIVREKYRRLREDFISFIYYRKLRHYRDTDYFYKFAFEHIPATESVREAKKLIKKTFRRALIKAFIDNYKEVTHLLFGREVHPKKRKIRIEDKKLKNMYNALGQLKRFVTKETDIEALHEILKEIDFSDNENVYQTKIFLYEEILKDDFDVEIQAREDVVEKAIILAYLYNNDTVNNKKHVKYEFMLKILQKKYPKVYNKAIEKAKEIESRAIDKINEMLRESWKGFEKKVIDAAEEVGIDANELFEAIIEKIESRVNNLENDFRFELIPIRISKNLFQEFLEEAYKKIVQDAYRVAKSEAERILKTTKLKVMRKAKEEAEKIRERIIREMEARTLEIANNVLESLIKIAKGELKKSEMEKVQRNLQLLINSEKTILKEETKDLISKIKILTTALKQGDKTTIKEALKRLEDHKEVEGRAKALRSVLYGTEI